MYGGFAQRPIPLRGPNFTSTSPVAGQFELIDEATAGTVTASAHFTSRTTATVTVQVSGVVMPHIYSEGSIVEGAQTCAAGPATFHVSPARPIS